MKFLTEVGIGEVCSKQVLVRECYVLELKVGEKDVHTIELVTTGPQVPLPPFELIEQGVETQDK